MSPTGEVIKVADHAHKVELDLTRYELGISRTFSTTWDAFIRVPYFIKDQTATVLLEDSSSNEDRDAAIRSGRNHHRSETYQGFGDLEVGVGWRKRGLLGENSVLRCSLGIAIPTGDHESTDPLVAGDRGTEHLHLQFGNGTFDPIVDFYLGLPLTETWSFNLYGKGRFPLYENDAGYRGSVEGALIPRFTFLATPNLSLSAGLSASYFGYSKWNGRRDPNSGQFNTNAALSAGYKFSEGFTASFSALLPLIIDSFSNEDAMEPAPAFTLSLAWTF